MNAQRILLTLSLLLALGPASTMAQEITPPPLMEREAMHPTRSVPKRPDHREATAQPTTPPRETMPVRHLWGDLDQDGLRDLFVLDHKANVLLRNVGNGGFEDLTVTAFPDGAGKGGTGFFGDYNGDALPDLFLFQEKGFTLFRNDGRLHFSDVTETLGLPADLKGGQVQLEDYDNDGFGDLMVQTPGGDRIFRNRGERGFGEVNVTGPGRSSGAGPVPPMQAPGSANLPEYGWNHSPTLDAMFINDNSPGSVGQGVPEVEGGDDMATQNDIVDGTVTGEDIADESITDADIKNGALTGSSLQNQSVDPGKVTGTAATLQGSQSFDKSTFHIDAVNNRVGIGTTSPSISSLHVDSVETYGCRVETSKSSGWAIYGRASATAGVANGVYGESESTSGKGLYGRAKATTGTTYGVRGESESTSGRGVYGLASASSGTTYGIKGHSSSDEGFGVYGSSSNIGVEGYCGTTSGTTYGVRGQCFATQGAGVYGLSSASIGYANAIRGDAESETARAILGKATSTAGHNYGIWGDSDSPEGIGTKGSSTNIGVFGQGWSLLQESYGVYGQSNIGRGVYGIATDNSATNYGVVGTTDSPSGYGVYSEGDFGGTGSKYFVQPHPEDPSKEIRFVCLEGNESGTYFRGSSRLENGRSVIEVPEEFRLASEEDDLTVQITPCGPGAFVWVEEYNLQRIIVRGEADVEFHYFVNGVRRGFANHEPIRENHAWVPEYMDRPYGTQYPKAIRKMLVENGTLNPDYTPSKKTAARLGWNLRKYREETFKPTDVRESTGETSLFGSRVNEIE